MTALAWSADQYVRFEDERTRPARDLIARVPLLAPARIADLGCGPGNSTQSLLVRWPGAEVVGIDTAPDMLEAARARLPAVRFVEADVEQWMPDAPFDLLFANAVFQWIPDHIAVLQRLLAALAPGGVLAVQMPDNLSEPSHRLMESVIRSAPFADIVAGLDLRRAPLPAPRDYYDALIGEAVQLDIWHTVYNHPLADATAIAEWVKGTGLRPYLGALPQDLRASYLEAYRAGLADAYPPLADGRVLLRFPRLFLVATRR